MRKNTVLNGARKAKKDEFYTQLVDIEKEMEAYLAYDANVFQGKIVLLPCDDPTISNFTRYFITHFEELGLKKLISTSYAPQEEQQQSFLYDPEPGLFDDAFEDVNNVSVAQHGKIFVLDNPHTVIDVDDIPYTYLEGDGDFRSGEITKLRDEADMVITNPPFSLFRQFVPWVEDGDVQYSIIGNLNAITYKEVFYLIERNDLWLGSTISSGDREFQVPDSYPLEALSTRVDDDGKRYVRVTGVRWFTNIQHGKRHEPLELMTMEENLQHNNRIITNANSYKQYDHYDAIEIPFTSGIPSDYQGIMGVPISFLDKYCPEQFEIIGCSHNHGRPKGWDENVSMSTVIDGKSIYKRLFIQHRNDV